MVNVFLPFDTEIYQSINGNHPLLDCLTTSDASERDGIEFWRCRDVGVQPVDSVLRDCANFAGMIRTGLPGKLFSTQDDREAFVASFTNSRHLGSQLQTPSDMLSFHHTAPMHVQQSDWVLHIESISQIFRPFIRQGRPLDPQYGGLHDHPAFWAIRKMLEDSRCKAVFSNLRHTIEQCRTVFGSDVIDGKLHHIPAGPRITANQQEIIERGIARRQYRDNIRILFTNSWRDHEAGFVVRGGMELVWGFLQIADACPHLELIIRAAIPDVIAESPLGRAMIAHPRIRIMDRWIPDDDIIGLFANTDIFYLNAAALHSVSILRAMHCGHVCLVSDVPGFDEYCEDGENAIVLPGRRAQINRIDQQSGWVFDDYSEIKSSESAFYAESASRVAQRLAEIYRSHELRSRLSHAARTSVQAANSFEAWKGGFDDLVFKTARSDRQGRPPKSVKTCLETFAPKPVQDLSVDRTGCCDFRSECRSRPDTYSRCSFDERAEDRPIEVVSE